MQDERAEEAGCLEFLRTYKQDLKKLMKDPIKNKREIEELKGSYKYAKTYR